jgi:manganese transport protein
MSGDVGATRLLVLSQVILSLQLPFAVVPLVAFTASRAKMGALVSPLWLRIAAWTIAAVVIGLNLTLLVGFL